MDMRPVGWRKRLYAWHDFIVRGNWPVKITAEADQLRADMSSVPSSSEVRATAKQATVKHACELLDEIDVWGKEPRSPRQWWTGEGLSRAWLQLYEAEAEWVSTLPDEIALCRLPEELADARRDIGDDDDPAVRDATSLYFEAYAGTSFAGRPEHQCAPQVLKRLIRRRSEVVFDRQARSLTLRNRIFRVMVVTVIILVVFFWVASAARLHWAPEDNAIKVSSFPSAWLTLLCVIIFGLLGGLISAIPVLARPPTSPDPYGLAVYQGTLKLPLGAVFAVIGCLALQSGTLPGVTGVTSLAGLLFWAAAFGASQQTVTRLLDARVGNLLTPPGQATLPHPPRTPADRGAQITDPGSAGSWPSDEPGHIVSSEQATASVDGPRESNEPESGSMGGE